MNSKTGVYIHIPFCRNKCDYCSFYSIPAAGGSSTIEDYIVKLSEEIVNTGGGLYPGEADTVYFGGGTPSLLKPGQLERILSAVRSRFSVTEGSEITLEMNPEDLTPEKIRACLDLGINRIVLGVQSLNNVLRTAIGRRGSSDIREKLDLFFSDSGFTRCIDIIAGIPEGGGAGSIEDIKTVSSYRPEHISLYLLSVDEGTPLASRFSPDDLFDEMQAEVWSSSINFLTGCGYNHYEISNYSLPGFESRHNSKYWHFLPYAGFGAGAHSFTGSARYSNNMTVEEYLSAKDAVYTFDERSDSDLIVEFFMTALRDLRGVSADEFRRVAGFDLPVDILKKLNDLTKKGLIQQGGGLFTLTKKGLFCANRVIYELTENYIR